MMLTAEEMDDVPDVDAAMLDEVLRHDAFGKFVILSKTDDEFIQAGCDWRPDDATKAFLAARSGLVRKSCSIRRTLFDACGHLQSRRRVWRIRRG
jgi:hypothetical protein